MPSRITLVLAVGAVLIPSLGAGCDRQGDTQPSDAAASSDDPDAGAVTPPPSPISAEEGIKLLEAKGWKAKHAPDVKQDGGTTITVFTSEAGISVRFAEYADHHQAAKAAETWPAEEGLMQSFRRGKTAILVRCPEGTDAKECERFANDLER